MRLPTEYEVIDARVLTGYCDSPLGPDFDEFGELAPADITAVRVLGLPPELDLHFTPTPSRDSPRTRRR